jgi:large subunit ribosomal protein L4e
MAASRPTVTVYQFDSPDQKSGSTAMPSVFSTPLRPDLVRYIHTNMAKNHRQAYANKSESGYQYSATSWGTGRAVSRIPRISGSGTHIGSAGAFGNMCRGGGMFAPTKTWRRWHRKVNVTQKRHAAASAIAASALPALVMARGHRVEEVSELPLVMSQGAEGISKTKKAVELLKKCGLGAELEKVLASKKIRAGQGKMRNKRYTMRRGPLVIYKEDNGISRAFRAIPGVDLACVSRMNLLQLAPGGTFGRLIIWTEPAFKELQALFGSFKAASEMKKGYRLMRPMMTNADLGRIINSDEVQSAVAPAKEAPKRATLKRNPLKNRNVMAKLNPGSLQRRKLRELQQTTGTKEREAILKQKRATAEKAKAHHKGAKEFYSKMMSAYEEKAAAAAAGEDEE